MPPRSLLPRVAPRSSSSRSSGRWEAPPTSSRARSPSRATCSASATSTTRSDQAFKNTMDYSHWMANPRLVRAIVDESGSTIGWLQEQGVVFTEATINMPDSPLTYHVIKGKGEAVVKALVDQAKSKGVQILPGIAGHRAAEAGRPHHRCGGGRRRRRGGGGGQGGRHRHRRLRQQQGVDQEVHGLRPGGQPDPRGQHRQDGRRPAHGLGGRGGRGGREHHRDVPRGSGGTGVRHGLQPRAGGGAARSVGHGPGREVLRRDHRLLRHAGGQRPGPLQGRRLHLQHPRRLHRSSG